MRLLILAALLATISLASTVNRVVPEPLANSVLMEVEQSATEEPAATPTEAPSAAPTKEPSTCQDKTLEDGQPSLRRLLILYGSWICLLILSLSVAPRSS